MLWYEPFILMWRQTVQACLLIKRRNEFLSRKKKYNFSLQWEFEDDTVRTKYRAVCGMM